MDIKKYLKKDTNTTKRGKKFTPCNRDRMETIREGGSSRSYPKTTKSLQPSQEVGGHKQTKNPGFLVFTNCFVAQKGGGRERGDKNTVIANGY